MKKLILIGLLGVIVTSCQKEYTCECTMYYSNGTVMSNTSTTVKGNKETATDKCAENEINQTGSSNYRTCNLK